MPASLMVLSSLLLAAASPAKPAPATVTLEHCLVSLLNAGEAQVPVKEAGVVLEVGVVEGQQVKAGDLLARIDDIDAQLAAKASRLELDVANEEAASSALNVEHSHAACDVAQAEYEQGIDANRRTPDTFSKAELRRLLLTWKRSTLEIKKAESDQKVAGLKAKVSQAKTEVAAENVRRRQVTSPLNGQVVEVRCHAGEWVKAGDPVVYVVRLDRLRIEGFLDAADIEPGEADQRPVTVSIRLARGHQENFSGRIVFVSPLVQMGEKFRVLAEVDNRQQNGHWLLRPGQTAEMTIQLK